MAIRNVVTEGDEILRKHCREVKEITPRLRETMKDMFETMTESYGVGIAGPQVGVMRRIFVAQPDPTDMDRVYFMINPVMLEMSEEKEWGIEGCLSVPDMIGDVERSVDGIVRAGVDQRMAFFEAGWRFVFSRAANMTAA